MNSEWADAITTLLNEMAKVPTFTAWLSHLPDRYKQLLSELVEQIDPRNMSPRTAMILELTHAYE